MLQVKTFVFNEFQENTYVVWDETLECAIIDPGCGHSSEQKELKDFIKDQGLKASLLLNTHCHIDHILGNSFVADYYQLPLHLHEGELYTYNDANRWAAMFGLPNFTPPQQLVYLQAGIPITFGSSRFEVLSTPGHSIASLSFYNPESQFLFSGDVIFQNSIGRTDLPGGNFEILAKSIREVIYELPEATQIFSGHGPITQVASERKNNPFVKPE
jgi:glyoxylase-like metal-dependent hydrolase (beta-lactamase superfamily II)